MSQRSQQVDVTPVPQKKMRLVQRNGEDDQHRDFDSEEQEASIVDEDEMCLLGLDDEQEVDIGGENVTWPPDLNSPTMEPISCCDSLFSGFFLKRHLELGEFE